MKKFFKSILSKVSTSNIFLISIAVVIGLLFGGILTGFWALLIGAFALFLYLTGVELWQLLTKTGDYSVGS